MVTLVTIPTLSIGELLLFIEDSPSYSDFVQNVFNNFLPASNFQFITQLLQSFATYSPTSVVWQNFVANIISGGGGGGGGIDQIVSALSVYGMTQANWMAFMVHIVNTPAFQAAINPEILAYLGTPSTYNATVGSDWYKFMGNITRSSILSPPLNPLPNPLNPATNSANPFITGLAANAEFQSWLQSMIAINDPPPLSFWQENGSSPGIFARRQSSASEEEELTTTPTPTDDDHRHLGSLTAVGPNWVSWRPKVTNQEVSIAVAPSLTGAFYLTDPSAVSPPNARGQNAVDLQMVRSAATQVASGDQSFVAGANNTASGPASVALNTGTTASGINAYAEGNQTTASGNNSHAEGQLTAATFLNTHAEGISTTATGLASHVEGGNTITHGHYSHAEGLGGVTYGVECHAEGLDTVAGDSANINDAFIGRSAHAEGDTCSAITQASHAGGIQSLANGLYAFLHANGGSTTSPNGVLMGYASNASSTTNMVSIIGYDINSTSSNQMGTTLFGHDLTAAVNNDGAGHTIQTSSIQLGGGGGGGGVVTTGAGLSWMALTTAAGASGSPATGGTWGTFNATTGTPSFASYMEWDSKQQQQLASVGKALTEHHHCDPTSLPIATPSVTLQNHQLAKRIHDAIESQTVGRFVFWSSEPGEHHRIRLGESPASPSKTTGGLIGGLLGGRRVRAATAQLATDRHLGVVCSFTAGGVIFNDPMTGWAHRTQKDAFNTSLVDEDWAAALKSQIKGMQIPMDAELKGLLQVVQDERGSVDSIDRVVAYLSRPLGDDKKNDRLRSMAANWSLPSNTMTSGEFFNARNGACLTPNYRPDLWFLRCRARDQIPVETRQEHYLLRAIARAKQKKDESTALKEESDDAPQQEESPVTKTEVTIEPELVVEVEDERGEELQQEAFTAVVLDVTEGESELDEMTTKRDTGDVAECKGELDEMTTKRDTGDVAECKGELDEMTTKRDTGDVAECKGELDAATKQDDDAGDLVAMTAAKIAATVTEALMPLEIHAPAIEITPTELATDEIDTIAESSARSASTCPLGHESVDGICVPIEGITPQVDIEVEVEATEAVAVIEEVVEEDDMDEDTMMALVNGEGDAFYFLSHEQWAEFCDGIQARHVTFNGQVDEIRFAEWKQQLKTRVVPGLPELRSVMDHQRAVEIERAYRKRWMVKTYEVCRVYSKHEKRQFLASLRDIKPLRVARANPAFKPELAQSYKNRSARPHEWAMIQFGGVVRARHDGTAIAGQEVIVLADGCVSLAEQYAPSNTSAHKTYQCMRVINEEICEIFLL